MVNNFWLDKRRQKDFAEKSSEIAKHFKMELRDLFSRSPAEKYRLMDEYFKAQEKKAKKVKSNG